MGHPGVAFAGDGRGGRGPATHAASAPSGPAIRVTPTVLALLALAALAVLRAPAPAEAETLAAKGVLPPGQSGFVSVAGLPTGTGSPHLTDQVEPFVTFNHRSLMFDRPGETETPKPGVTIVRDRWGVPSITADSNEDAWWGVGYAVAQDRLFELELFKRATSGRLAEIVGPSFLEDDIIARRDYYTDAEINRMIETGPPQLRERATHYTAGINAWIDHVRTNPDDMPGEYVALGVPLTDWTIQDSARVGVFLARTVPSGDGAELAGASALQQMSPRNFKLIHPLRTPGARASVPRSEGRFPRVPGRTKRDTRIGFKRSLEFARGLDLEGVENTAEQAAEDAGVGMRGAPGADLRRVLPSPGGSFMWAIGDRRRDRAFQFNGPQLGYSIPELFWEFELHAPELPNIRGVTAPGVPLVGIGHNGHVAWGFTSGLSDEDDLYVEELTGDETYRFKGKERQMDCRDEEFEWRTPPTDLPGLVEEPPEGPPAGATTVRICRTVHGPVQYRGDGQAYARRYAIWKRELETFKGIDMLNKAKTIRDVDRAMRKVTWNENVLAADDRGNIGYWHPGLHQLYPDRWDERLPFPGTGEAEWPGLLPRARTPHAINPDRGWLVNWNNVPSTGWTNGDGESRERMTGPFHRVGILEQLVSRVARNPSYRRSTKIVKTSGTTAQQRPLVDEALLRRARRIADGTAAKALRALLKWDGSYHRTNAEDTVDPGVAVWELLKYELRKVLVKPMGEGAEIIADGGGEDPFTNTSSSHRFDIANGEATALRVLGARDYARAAEAAADFLTKRYGTKRVSRWREPRRMYEVSAQGAGQVEDLPFFDRGTWEQSVLLGRR